MGVARSYTETMERVICVKGFFDGLSDDEVDQRIA